VRELLSYVFSPLREGDIALYGAPATACPRSCLLPRRKPRRLRERLKHDMRSKANLTLTGRRDKVALTRYNDRMTLVPRIPAGAGRSTAWRPLEVSHFLSIAIPLAGSAPPSA